MSDISILSHEYRSASEFSHLFTSALLYLKKSHFLTEQQEAPTNELAECRKVLASVLAELILALKPDEDETMEIEAPADVGKAHWIPGALVVDLLQSHGDEVGWYVEELEETSKRLQDRQALLTEGDFRLLDELASIADAKTSQVFNRMMRQ